MSTAKTGGTSNSPKDAKSRLTLVYSSPNPPARKPIGDGVLRFDVYPK